jgi:RHS repeat-associated protein
MGYAENDGIRQKFIAKERDSESGLDYFGARYYSNGLGRFTSSDPSNVSISRANPQSWNRYSYALNNPLRYLDRNGKWPTPAYGGTWTHADIVDHAFPGLSQHQRQVIKDGSARVDQDQSRAGAYKHGMTPYHGDRGQAIRDSNQYVKDSEGAARAAQKDYADKGGKGLSDGALEAYSPAFHERTDETSPAHAGQQEWRGLGEGNFRERMAEREEAAEHVANESSATDAEKAASIEAARQTFRETFDELAYQEAIKDPKEKKK